MSVVIDGTQGVTSSGSFYGQTTFTGTYTDGIVVDYTTGLGRISVGASDGLAFYRGGLANTESMRIDSSGNLGVGLTSIPNAQGTSIAVGNTSGANINITSNSAAGTSGSPKYLDLRFLGYANNEMAKIRSWDESSSTAYGNLTFWTGVNGATSERARIDSSGNFLVGYAGTTSYRFNVYANASTYSTYLSNANASPYGVYIQHTAATPNGTGNEFITCWDSTAVRFTLRSNGGIANYSANNVNLSDRREKTNFAPAGEYLPKICAIPVQTFNYADQNLEEDDGLTLGVVAQDVQAVAPELVCETNWGSKEEPKMRLSIYQTDLQYALMKCIQEQQAIIQQLQADVAALKGKA